MITNHTFDATTPMPIMTGHPSTLLPIIQAYNRDGKQVSLDVTVSDKGGMLYVQPGLLATLRAPLTLVVMT